MVEMVEARRNGNNSEQRYDLFSGLLDAAQDELDSEGALSDEELFGGYSTLRSFTVLRFFGNCLIRRPRKHVYLSSCWTRGAILFFLRCCAKPVP